MKREQGCLEWYVYDEEGIEISGPYASETGAREISLPYGWSIRSQELRDPEYLLDC